MYRKLILLGLAALLFFAGCKEEMVGAPCRPETDNGDFNVEITGETWSIETGSVQCATRICLTQVSNNDNVLSSVRDACIANPTVENCWSEDGGPVQLKFSFCSCRCADAEGHTLSDNPDKYDDLCECPPSTRCEEVMQPIEGASDKLAGSYCIPKCISEPCKNTDPFEICTPSKNSEEPWKWFCDEMPSPVTGQDQEE